MGANLAEPELREVEKRPFGVYAIIGLLLLSAGAAALDIVRIRVGYSSRFLEQIAVFLREGTALNALSYRYVSDEQILLLINIFIIALTFLTALGLWLRRREAWVATMLLIGVGLIYNIWSYLAHSPLYWSMLINVVTVFYLNERSVQLAFERGRPAGEKAL